MQPKPDPIQAELADCIRLLKQDPAAFFRAYPQETTIIEYKAAYTLDAALDNCPLVRPKDKAGVFNEALARKIYETLVAFANTHGGLLVMGVAENGATIVDPEQQKRCRLPNTTTPCLEAVESDPAVVIGSLKVVGIDRELEIRGWHFDKFQRHLHDRFSQGKGKKQALAFKEKVYPCTPATGNEPQTKIIPSEGVDQYLEVFAAMHTDGNGRSCTLAGLAVQPSAKPIYLTIEESGSQNLMYALPVRKTGKTELENDLKRIENYLFNRFKNDIADAIVEQLAARIGDRHAGLAAAMVQPGDLPALAADLAARWRSEGWVYHLVEQFGRPLRPYLEDLSHWENEHRPEVLALLLMVSLHFSAGWEKWTPRNAANPEAVKALLEVLHMRKWWRTRFRALYALQFMDQALIAKALRDKRHRALSRETINALSTNVPQKTVTAFIQKTIAAKIPKVSEKAAEVLVEIANAWNDPGAGIDLPL